METGISTSTGPSLNRIPDPVIISVLLPFLGLWEFLMFASMNRRWRIRLRMEDVWKKLIQRDQRNWYFTPEEAQLAIQHFRTHQCFGFHPCAYCRDALPSRLDIRTVEQLLTRLPGPPPQWWTPWETPVPWQTYMRTQEEVMQHLITASVTPNLSNIRSESVIQDDICVIAGPMSASKFLYLAEHCYRKGIRPLTAKHLGDTWLAVQLRSCHCLLWLTTYPLFTLLLIYLVIPFMQSDPLRAMEIIVWGGLAASPAYVSTILMLVSDCSSWYHHGQFPERLLSERWRWLYILGEPVKTIKDANSLKLLFDILWISTTEVVLIFLFGHTDGHARLSLIIFTGLGVLIPVLIFVHTTVATFEEMWLFRGTWSLQNLTIWIRDIMASASCITFVVLVWIRAAGFANIAYLLQAIPVIVSILTLNDWINTAKFAPHRGLFVPLIVFPIMFVVFTALWLDNAISWSLYAIFSPLIPLSLVLAYLGIHHYRLRVKKESKRVDIYGLSNIWSQAQLTDAQLNTLRRYRSRSPDPFLR